MTRDNSALMSEDHSGTNTMKSAPRTGPRIDAAPPITMAIMALLAYKGIKHLTAGQGAPNPSPYVKDAFHNFVVHGDAAAVNLASFVITLVAAACLGSAPAPWQSTPERGFRRPGRCRGP